VVPVLGRFAFGWLAGQHARIDPFLVLDGSAAMLTLLRGGVAHCRGD
jgi:hypothetical protein